MSYVERHAVSITTAADGSATAYSPVVTGKISRIRYAKTDFSNGVDFAITVESTGEAVWTGTDVNASATVLPRQPTHDTLGAAALYAASGAAVLDKIALANDRIKIVIAAGGDTKTGTFHIVLE